MGKSKRDRELEFEVQAPPQKKNCKGFPLLFEGWRGGLRVTKANNVDM